MENSMIKANLDPRFEILERDKIFYHIRFEKTNINPSDPLHPVVRYYIQPIRTIDYRNYFLCPADRAVDYLKAMNVTGAQVVHDPTLLTAKEKVVKPEPKSAELISRESKMRMTKGDVLKMMEEKKASDE